MKTTHASPDWTFTQGTRDYLMDIEAEGEIIAHICTTDPVDATEREIANGRLIKAAPKMLKALRLVVEWAESDNLDSIELVETARNAIAEME